MSRHHEGHASRPGRHFGFFRTLKTVFALLLIGALAFTVYYGYNYFSAKVSGLEAELSFLKEKEKVSTEQIEEKLSEIGELATSLFEYKSSKHISNTRQAFGVDIPGTTNEIDITYSGIIKVGYDVNAITFSTDDEKMLITVTLPEPRVLDNYIIFDGMECTESNSILNPTSYEKLAGYFTEIEAEELKKAESEGIYELAEEQARSIIEHYLAAFADYTVEFK